MVPSNSKLQNGLAAQPQGQPGCQVQIGRERRQGTAAVVEPLEPGYDRLWKIVNENNKDRYTAYQKMTDRPIPVVVITPV